MEDIVFRIHPTSIFEAEGIVNHPVHTHKLKIPDLEFTLRKTDYESILAAYFFKQSIEDSQVIVPG